MLTFTAEKKTPWPRITKIFLISVVAFAVYPVYHLLSRDTPFNENYYWFAAGFFALELLILLTTSHLYQLTIDEEAGNITHHFMGALAGQSEKVIMLKRVRIYIRRSSKGQIRSIDFFKEYREVASLRAGKHAFSPATLEAVHAAFEKLGARITDPSAPASAPAA